MLRLSDLSVTRLGRSRAELAVRGRPDPKYAPAMTGPNVRRWLFASVLLAIWSIVRPAAAMPAGLCDDRGACAIAPPPSLQTPETSIGRAAPARSALASVLPFDGKVGGCPHDGPTDFQLAGVDPVTLVGPLILAVPGCDLWNPWTIGCLHRSGARMRVERPPRP